MRVFSSCVIFLFCYRILGGVFEWILFRDCGGLRLKLDSVTTNESSIRDLFPFALRKTLDVQESNGVVVLFSFSPPQNRCLFVLTLEG